jgi:hypothetical protein
VNFDEVLRRENVTDVSKSKQGLTDRAGCNPRGDNGAEVPECIHFLTCYQSHRLLVSGKHCTKPHAPSVLHLCDNQTSAFEIYRNACLYVATVRYRTITRVRMRICGLLAGAAHAQTLLCSASKRIGSYILPAYVDR